MIGIETMTAERWVSLFQAAGVEDLEALTVSVISGPAIQPPTDLTLVIVTEEHALNMHRLWPEIEAIWERTWLTT